MADSQLAQIIAIYATGQIGAYFATAATAVFMYEWMLTFDREVDLFWRRKVTVSSILFLVNRYLPFVVILIFAPWQNPPTTGKRCAAQYYIGDALEILQYVPWAVFSALRAYVLSSKGWPVATLVFLLSLAPVGVNYATMAYATTVVDPLLGCEVILKLPDTVTREIFPIVSRVSLLLSDLLVLAITCYYVL
ncbi:hypothetical protein L227DRAFT_569085 [Lentinus tigrinus ALCF2SS1-6]|uniref:DUF6533 domain-containing protein n=1 Tax=Lentinus tigrinus ALCF2SS1-6 TaxID=1328759 RepID=A0A5C2SSP0_9APHY|nr:hypothetical protein L227DRAFT_569085 [Lentinus tigrinus ALCF2SS1-6]